MVLDILQGITDHGHKLSINCSINPPRNYHTSPSEYARVHFNCESLSFGRHAPKVRPYAGRDCQSWVALCNPFKWSAMLEVPGVPQVDRHEWIWRQKE